MSFTDKDNNVIKEKLMDAQMPPVEDAWAKMNEILGPPPIQAAPSAMLGKINKIYLNVFIGVFIISSALFLHSAVKKNDINSLRSEALRIDFEGQSSEPTSLISETASIEQQPETKTDPKVNHLDPIKHVEPTSSFGRDQLLTRGKSSEITTKSNQFISQKRFNTTSQQHKVIGANLQAPTETRSELIPEKKVTRYVPYDEEEEEGFDEENMELWTYQPKYQNSFFGVRFGIQGFPDVKWNNMINTVSGGVFYREYLDLNKAIQIELLYNPLVFSPIRYVERSLQNGKVVVDSALVSHARQISLPIQLYFQNDGRIDFMVGAQYSYIWSLQGDLYKKIQNTTGSDIETKEYTKINNQNAFIKHDVAFVAELNFQATDRISVGFRAQQSLLDFSKSKLGNSVHRLNALQIKAGFILIK